jgi:hypothetical protein
MGLLARGRCERVAKSEVIFIRVDAEVKRRLEEAAESQGLTLTSFLIRAAEAAAGAVTKKRAKFREPSHTVPRKTSGACPTFFKAICQEARRGGELGYDWAGRNLLRKAASLISWDTVDQLKAKEAELSGLVWSRDDTGVLAWFDRELPRCMALIPRRRRKQFLLGIYKEVEEDGVRF